VERVTGQDASFLYNETPTQHMHTLKVAIVDPTTVPGGSSIARVREVLARRLHLLPPFRRRLVQVPFNLSHPWWIEDPDFDLDNHLHAVTLDEPSAAELDAVISWIASRPLDRSRPLWEMWVIDGLEGGLVAFIAKIHHCAADGVMAAELLANVMETDRSRLDPPSPEAPWRPDPVPTRGQLLRLAARDILVALLALPALLVLTTRGLYALMRNRRRLPAPRATPFRGARTSFNGALHAERTFVTGALPLERIKAVKSAFNVSVNDVVLALCTGALRSYLADRNELPTKPLIAGVPVSTRAPGAPLRANSVSNLFVALPVEIEDPAERLEAIHASTRGAKEVHNLLGVDLLAGWSEMTPGGPYGAFIRWYGRKRLADKSPPPINLIVSNVPGPREPLFIAGAELCAIFSMGPLLEGVGLNVTVWSYRDAIYTGVVSCPQLIPDLRGLVARFEDALDELEAATVAYTQR
jgi:diacylglycerol O-acyltransferase